MQNVLINMCEKFHNDRLIDKRYILRESKIWQQLQEQAQEEQRL